MNLPITDPVLIVALAMAVFLVMPLLTERLRLPGIIGVLLAGLVLGPHGTGLLARDATIHLLGTVGLLYLVFLAGLEVDLGDLNRKRGRAITFGVITFLVPMIFGGVGAWLFFDLSIPTAVLLGSVLSSHSFLALLIAKRMGLTDRELVIAVVGGTVITDTLALLVLAVIARSTEGGFGFWFLLRLFLQMGVFAGLTVFVLPLLGRWYFRHVSEGRAQFMFMLTVLFACGYLAHVAGLEPIIGAFLGGLAMNRLVPRHGVLANRVFFVGDAIFVPFFLLSVGMLIDLRMVVGDTRTIVMAVFMCGAVTAGKGLAAWSMRLLFGYRRSEAVVAWGLSLPQAATTLAVVLVGHELALFDDAVLNATIVMVLVTCVLGPLLVEYAGRRLAHAQAVVEPQEEAGRLQRILIPLANPQSSNHLLDFAMAMRRSLSNEPLLPLSVAADDDRVATSERLLSTSVLHVAAADIPVMPVIRVDVNPVSGIQRAMSELRASCLVVGWSGPRSVWQRYFHLSHGPIDHLIAETTVQLIVFRQAAPLSVIERVVLALPEHIDSESGFPELVLDCKLLVKRIGAALTLCGPGAAVPTTRRFIERTGMTCPMLDDLEENPGITPVERLAESLSPHDMLIIVGCREGTPSWHGRWNRVPHVVCHNRPDVSVAVAFPRLAAQADLRGSAGNGDEPGSLFANAHLCLQRSCPDIPSLIDEALLETGVPPASREEIAPTLKASISALNEQVVLAHAHIRQVDAPRLTIMTTPKGIAFPGGSLRILIVLLNPLAMPTERHLRNLAVLARAMSDAGRVEELIAATDEQEARACLLRPA